ncbi:SDR family oxidoreductase [Halobacillus locisalis]|uniref:SDR family oxidoreductase n=1 Tax=Halobacillus locisalis TaxID=220753 RepID=A0A838CS69_9BACI|nr:NAD(P)-binding oxidoreductase [Halobacillus locisalis]MBA2174718.1 SDR family oxidoreductase [Halobacillus locisalis]
MKMIVFGATGGTGHAFVEQAMANGHEVTAFVRNPSKLAIQHDRLHMIEGDALNEEDVVQAIEGHESVVSCLGSENLKKSDVLEQMTGNIVRGMQKHGLKRIVYVASAGIQKEIPGFLGWMSQRILKNVLKDHRNAVNAIVAAELDYTVARPLRLLDGDVTGEYRQTDVGVPENGKQINRSDVAHFLLTSLEENRWVRETVGLAY